MILTRQDVVRRRLFGPAIAGRSLCSPHHLICSPHPSGVYKDPRSPSPLSLRSYCAPPSSHLQLQLLAPATLALRFILLSSTAMRLSLNPVNLTLVLVTLATLAQPASASSLYHETCTGACNGAYAHCCAHVTSVIGESGSGSWQLKRQQADPRRVPGRSYRARRSRLLPRTGYVLAGVRQLLLIITTLSPNDCAPRPRRRTSLAPLALPTRNTCAQAFPSGPALPCSCSPARACAVLFVRLPSPSSLPPSRVSDTVPKLSCEPT